MLISLVISKSLSIPVMVWAFFLNAFLKSTSVSVPVIVVTRSTSGSPAFSSEMIFTISEIGAKIIAQAYNEMNAPRIPPSTLERTDFLIRSIDNECLFFSFFSLTGLTFVTGSSFWSLASDSKPSSLEAAITSNPSLESIAALSSDVSEFSSAAPAIISNPSLTGSDCTASVTGSSSSSS